MWSFSFVLFFSFARGELIGVAGLCRWRRRAAGRGTYLFGRLVFEFVNSFAEQPGTTSRRVPLSRLHLLSRMGLRLNKFNSFGVCASSSLTACRLFACRRLCLASRLTPLRSAYTLVVGKAASSRQGSSTALRRCRRHSPRFARRYARFARCALALGSGSPSRNPQVSPNRRHI